MVVHLDGYGGTFAPGSKGGGVVFDPRGVRISVVWVDDEVRINFKGSRNPFPRSKDTKISRNYKVIGPPSIAINLKGTLAIEYPIELSNGETKQIGFYAKYDEFDDPSDDEPPPPTPVTKIEKSIRVKELLKSEGHFIGESPYFFKTFMNQAHPSIPGKTPEYSFDDREYIAERISKEGGGHGNFLRFLCDIGYYESDTLKILGDFFLRDQNGIFITNPPKVDPLWLDVMHYSGDLFVEREWMIQLDFLNNSTLHSGDKGWKYHPANPDNNNGVYVPELGVVYPTHYDVHSWHGHFFQWSEWGSHWQHEILIRQIGIEAYNKLSEEEAESQASQYDEGDMDNDQLDDMYRNKATKILWLWHLELLLSYAKSWWGDMFMVGHNEWQRAANFHVNDVLPVYRKYGLTKDRLVTSLAHEDWYQKTTIFDKYMASIHGIYYVDPIGVQPDHADGIGETVSTVPYKAGFSSDGHYWGKFGKDYNKLEEAVIYALTHGLFYELNNDWWGPQKQTDYDAGAVCGEALRKFLETS